jgi:hypothetical protein
LVLLREQELCGLVFFASSCLQSHDAGTASDGGGGATANAIHSRSSHHDARGGAASGVHDVSH